MFKDVLNHADLTCWAQWGLAIFFICFVAITIWAYTRPRRELHHWSILPLVDEPSDSDSEARHV